MGILATITAALQAIPTIAGAIKDLIALCTRIANEIETQRKIHEFEAARRLSRETGNTSELERMLGRNTVK